MFQINRSMFNTICYRKIHGLGWYVQGYTKAKELGLKHYALVGGVCSKGHHAPMSVQHTKCIQCIAIAARYKDPGMTNAESFEFWRRKLKLPKIENPGAVRYIYVVENMPYTRITEATLLSGIPENLIYVRCKSEDFPEYQKIPTQFRRGQTYVYHCKGKEYNRLHDAAKAEGVKPHAVLKMIHNPKEKDWYRVRLL